jgi:hypothetical protein
MPTPLTDVDTFTDPIQGPADADPQAAAAYNLGFQGLANRTRNLKNMHGTNNVPLLSPTPDVVRTIPIVGGTPLKTGGVPHWDLINASGVYTWESTTNDGDLLLPINASICGVSLDGATPFGTVAIKSISVWWRNGAARTGNARPEITLYKQTVSAGAIATTALGNAFGADSAAPAEHTTTLTLGAPAAMDHREDFFLRVTAGNTGGTGGQQDRLYRVLVTASMTRVAL